MDKVFLDTNICIDLITGRTPFFDSAIKIVDLVAQGKIELYVSSGSIYTTIYIAAEVYKIRNTPERIISFLAYTEILETSRSLIRQALLSDFKDKDDALQYFTAITACDYLLTRNKNHFKTGKAIPVYSTEEFVNLYNL
jgi:predicted nucleic acid-binding protein